MKIKRWLVFITVSIILVSCDKNSGPFVQVKGIENLIYLSIKAYRTDNGLDGPFVHQPIMINEAQIYSYKMANGLEPVGTQGLTEHWNTIHEKIGGYNDQAIVLSTNTNDEDEILSQLLKIPDADSILLKDVTQCAVGVEADTAGINYVTIIMMKVDS